MPCHAIPSTPSTVEDHSHTDSPTLTGLESCAQAFRGPNSILRGTQMHTQWATTGQPAKVLRSPPLLSTGEDRSRATSGPGLDYPPSQLAVGHRLGAPSPRDHDATGQVLRSPPMLPTGKGQGTLKSHPPATQALRLALSGKGPRPVHPANWRRVLDVESRPSSTCDARGRSLGVSPPPSARRCRGTLMGRCVLHKSSQGSG